LIIMTKANVKPVPSFSTAAKSIGGAFKAFENAGAKLSAQVCAAMQSYLDACLMAGIGREQKEVESIGRAIRENEIVATYVALGAFERKTFTEYAQSAMRAHFHGVPFTPALKNDPAYALPWGGAKSKASAGKGGKVESTDRAALDATLSKAIKQARLLGLLEFAAELVDICADSLDGFKEAE
jgi:hypothetical protein